MLKYDEAKMADFRGFRLSATSKNNYMLYRRHILKKGFHAATLDSNPQVGPAFLSLHFIALSNVSPPPTLSSVETLPVPILCHRNA